MRFAILLLLISFHAISQDHQGLKFIENKGQWEPGSDFQARVPGGRVGVSATGFSIMLLDMEELERRHLATHEAMNEAIGHSDDEPLNGHYFEISLLGSNPHARAVISQPLDGHYNYFLGNDQTRWVTHAKAFGTVLYPEVYMGIDFRVSSVGNNLKYDFIVKPGADPAQIRLEYRGTLGVAQTGDDLEISTTVGTLTEQKPFSYQGEGSKKQGVPSAYRLENNTLSFSFPEGYDASRTLVIDPLLIFSTYSGSTADNWGSTATPGEHGTLYSAGVTSQSHGGNFPATPGAFQLLNKGAFDMAIIKYDSAGTRFLYATMLGGQRNDSPQSLVVDKATGDLLVLGISSSSDYPTGTTSYDQTFNFGTTIYNKVLDSDDQWDLVITRLSPNGDRLIGSTYLGGSGNEGLNRPKELGGPLVANYGDEMRGDIITDETGHVFISSVTSSGDFPIVGGFDNSFNGVTDGVVAKLAPDLSTIIWSSYVGGAGFDAAYSIKFDSHLDLVLAGGTTSTNFPVTPGAYQTTFNGIVDGWIARIKADGTAIMQATFTGTNSFDQVYFIDLNASDHIYCYGQTAGHMPVTSGVYRNANSGQFVQKLAPDLSALEFSTVFGSGSTNGLVIPNISPTAFLVNDCDNIYMAGWGGRINAAASQGYWPSSTLGMPITTDAYQKTTSGSDFYFIVLNGDATQLVYSTYLGGNSSKTHVDGGTSRFDKFGIVYHAVCSGCAFETGGSSTSDFPTTPNAKSRRNLSSNCNNAAFKFDLSSLRAMFDTNNTALTMPGYNNVCYPEPIVFQNFSTGGKNITWDFDDGTIVNLKDTDPKNITHRYQQRGEYHVKLKIIDLSTCSQMDSVTKIIYYFKDNIKVGEDVTICDGTSFQLTASGGLTYSWYTKDGTFTSSQPSPTVQPTVETAYFVTVVDADGCTKKDTLTVGITPNVKAAFEVYDKNFQIPGYDNACFPDVLGFKNQSLHGTSYTWNFNDGTVPIQLADMGPLVHGFERQGTYTVKLTAFNPETCNKEHSVTKPVQFFKGDITASSDGEICSGSSYQLWATGASTYAWSADDRTFTSASSAPLVKPAKNTQYFVTGTDGHGCVDKDTVQVNVIDRVNLEWEHRLNGSCLERPTLFVKNLTDSADDVTFHFDFGDGTKTTDPQAEHVYETDGTYTVRLTARRQICFSEEVAEIPVYKLMVPNIFTPDGSPGYNDQFEVTFGADMIAPADIGLPVQLTVVDRWGKTVFESTDYKNDWNGSNLASGVYYVHLRVGDLASCKNWVHIVK
jgi:PKD repeat protein